MAGIKIKLKAEGTPEVVSESLQPSPAVSDRDTSTKPDDSVSAPVAVPRLSLNVGQTTTPRIRVKTGKHLVEGYDSEAPDREEDPVIEDAIVLRMTPGPGLEKLAQAVESNDFSNLSIKFEDPRRAVVTLSGERYAAQLVDLPTITEVQKTFDRKNIYKTIDISQMLLVTGKMAPEDNVMGMTAEPQLYPHGINPPLHNVRNRRFHQRMSSKAIETIEAKVDELFRKDLMSLEVEHKLVDPEEITQQSLAASGSLGIVEEEEDDEDDDDDDEEEEEEDEEDFMLGMELERALEAEISEGEDEDEDDDDDDDELDEDQQDTRQQNKLLKEEIKELQATIDSKQKDADNTVNQIMKGRLIDVVLRMNKELQMKQRLLQDVEAREAENNELEDGNIKQKQPGAQEDDDDDDAMQEDEDGASDLEAGNASDAVESRQQSNAAQDKLDAESANVERLNLVDSDAMDIETNPGAGQQGADGEVDGEVDAENDNEMDDDDDNIDSLF